MGSLAHQSIKMAFYLELLYGNRQSQYVLCETQSGGLCLNDFDLRCRSLRLVVMTVPFYYVNTRSGVGCLVLHPNGPFGRITLPLVAFFRPPSVIDV